MRSSHQSKVGYKDLISTIFNSFVVELWYQHYNVIMEIMHNIRTSSETFFSKKATWRLKKLRNNKKL